MLKDVLKTYFRIIAKPIAILCVFFALIGVISLTYWPNEYMRPSALDLAPEARAEELERLSNPLFLLTSLFTGNFGYSIRTRGLVSEELALRLPNTLLLIVVSIIMTAIAGSFLSLLFKPRQQKPQAFAHSLRNFLFGLAPVAALFLLWIFVFQVNAMSGSPGWFPLHGLTLIPPPEDLGARVLDVLWHLVLPVSALTSVGVLRILLILWSSGTPFTGKSFLKKSVYSLTTIDFALFISASVLIEHIFTWPGLGNMLIGCIKYIDLNAALAAFAVLLALGAGLGALSTLLDFVQIRFGLRKDLEREIIPESKTAKQPGHGSLTFVKALRKKKSMLIGAVILFCLVLLIVLAPIVAPYGPSTPVADSYAAPNWMKVFPQYSDYPSTIEVLPYWHVTEGSEFAVGGHSVEGSINTAGDIELLNLFFTSSFDYPHSVAPEQFIASFKWSVQDLTNAMCAAELLITNPNGTSYRTWFEPYASSDLNLVAEAASTDYWLLRQLGYDVPTFNLAHAVFATPARGEYNLIFHVSFRSEDQLERIKAEINLQDFKLLIPGRIHGILGTDFAGNDVFSQVTYAAGVDLAIALLISLVAVAVGFAIGFVAGYFHGWVDNLIMVFPDVITVFPVLPLLLILNALQPWNIFSLMLPSLLFLIAFTTTASRNLYLRRPKGQRLKEIGPARTLTSIARDVGANLCLTAASAVLLVTAISFIGFDDHYVPSLGKVLNHAFGHGAFGNLAWWWFFPPLIGIGLLALALFLIGYALDDG